MTKKPLIILGAGEQAKLIANTCSLQGYKKIQFLDDQQKGNDVIGKLEEIDNFDQQKYDFFVAFGNDDLRKKWFKILQDQKKSCINVIHPKAFLETNVHLGQNIMIGAFVYVNINTIIEDNVIVNNGCIIEHDNEIGINSQLAPGVITGGGVKISSDVFIGMGAVIRDHININSQIIVGAGAVVVNNLDESATYLGIPAQSK